MKAHTGLRPTGLMAPFPFGQQKKSKAQSTTLFKGVAHPGASVNQSAQPNRKLDIRG